MANISFKSVSLDFPIYNASSRSLKKRLFQVATGGRISSDEQGRVTVKALDDVTLEIASGERVGLLGHNGAGKSTMLRLLSGVYQATRGRAEINGEIGSLIDISLGIDLEATGRENIFLRGALLGMHRKTLENEQEAILEFAELGDFADMPIRTYSAGMHLRLAFAISTIMRPEILLMDEWLSVGDQGFKQRAKERLEGLVQSTKILIVATHSRELIETACNRAIWLEHGKIKMDGPAKLVAAEYFHDTDQQA